MRLPLKISAFTLIFLLILTGCSQKSAEDTASVSQGIQSGTELDVEVDSETDEELVWPQYKMGDLPEPDGTIISVTDNDGGTHVSVEGMSAADAADYVQKLKDLGYSPMAEGDDENGGIIFSAIRENITVVFMFNPSGGATPEESLCQITLENKA